MLSLAFENYHEETVQTLLGLIGSGASRIREMERLKAFHWAVSDGHEKIAHTLLATAGDHTPTLLWSHYGEQGWNSFQYVAADGRIGLAELHFTCAGKYLEDLLMRKTKDGFTPLHSAAAYGHTMMAMALLDRAGAQAPQLLQMQDNEGATALHFAAEQGQVETVKALLYRAGALSSTLLSIQNKQGLNPQQVAIRVGKTTVAKELQELELACTVAAQKSAEGERSPKRKSTELETAASVGRSVTRTTARSAQATSTSFQQTTPSSFMGQGSPPRPAQRTITSSALQPKPTRPPTPPVQPPPAKRSRVKPPLRPNVKGFVP